MRELALILPGLNDKAGSQTVFNPATSFTSGSTTLGSFITALSSVAIYAGAFLMLVYATWGVFGYIFAEGNKEGLAKARARIRWSIVGFIILIIAFFASDIYKSFLQPAEPSIQALSDPKGGGSPGATGFREIIDLFGFGKSSVTGQRLTLGDAISLLIPLGFSIAGLLVVFNLLIGAFDMINSNGDKNNIALARAKITHAIIGFILLIFLFLVFQYLPEVIWGTKTFKIIQ